MKTFPEDECIEESLAQAFKFQLRSKVPGFRRALKILTNELPPCYRDWQRFSGEKFDGGVQKLVGQILEQYYKEGYETPERDDTIDTGIKSSQGNTDDFPYSIGSYYGYLSRKSNLTWFPELPAPRATDSKFQSIPRRILRSQKPIRTFPFIQPYSYPNKKLTKFIRHLKREHQILEKSGGKHPALVLPNGIKITYTNSKRDFVPDYLAKQLSVKLGIPEQELMSF